MATMEDGVSSLWVVETRGKALVVRGYEDEFEAAGALLYRLWTQCDPDVLKFRIRELAENVCEQLDRDLLAKKG